MGTNYRVLKNLCDAIGATMPDGSDVPFTGLPTDEIRSIFKKRLEIVKAEATYENLSGVLVITDAKLVDKN